jgi:DDE superfamily endonuclease
MSVVRASRTDTSDSTGNRRVPDKTEGRAVPDGTLIATDRCAGAPAGYAGTNQDPYYSGKHHRHGVTMQGAIGPGGELLYPGDARCGSTHDTAAARADQIIEAAADADLELIADLGYHGVGGIVRTPAKRKPGRGLSPRDQRANREHARVRRQGERGFAPRGSAVQPGRNRNATSSGARWLRPSAASAHGSAGGHAFGYGARRRAYSMTRYPLA